MAAGKKARILVVDDEERNRRLMEALLLPLGYEVSLAVDGEDALKRIAKLKPDVVLLDIMMPKLDGFAVVKAIKDDPESARIPVVMVTALSETADRVKALEAGADDFLTKPVDKTELTARVKSLVKVKAYNDHMVDYQKELEAEVAGRTEELRLAFEKVKAASLDTIFRLSRAAEYKDEDTGAHIKRMSQYATCVARELGLPPVEVESILCAVPMHDIGKIGIPDKILLKPGKLTAEEWVVMRRHAEIGAQILEGSTADFIKLGSVVALTHHEKWDGTGYPHGIKGEDIPLSGRIVAIADVFDALTSKRPYRKREFTTDGAYQMIEENVGHQFDPAVFAAFKAGWQDILTIKEQFQDKDESRYLKMIGHTYNSSVIVTSENKKEAQAVTPIAEASGRKARILVVDDEPSIRSLVRTILTQQGHTVEEIGKVEEVLPRLERFSYDIIFLDIHMSGINSIELHDRIIRKQPGIIGKVIFITGDTSSQDARTYLHQNKLPYISKPFDRATMIIRVNDILGSKQR